MSSTWNLILEAFGQNFSISIYYVPLEWYNRYNMTSKEWEVFLHKQASKIAKITFSTSKKKFSKL